MWVGVNDFQSGGAIVQEVMRVAVKPLHSGVNGARGFVGVS